MNTLLENLEDLTVAMKLQCNTDNNEHNEMMDQIADQAENLITLKTSLDAAGDIIAKQYAVIEANIITMTKDSDRIRALEKQNRAYVLLDPARLVQVNKGQKKTIATLKEKLADVESKRKATLAELKMLKGG